MRRQAELLRQAIGPERLEQHLLAVRERLLGSWTTLGINQGIVGFFSLLESDLDHLRNEAAMADRTVAAIYRRHNEAYPLMAVDAPRLELEAFARELQQLRLRADHFRLRPSTLLTEQHRLTRRFLGTLAQSVVDLHRRLRGAIERWEAEVLLPLLQFNQERKQLLEQQLLEMRALAQASRQARTRGRCWVAMPSNWRSSGRRSRSCCAPCSAARRRRSTAMSSSCRWRAEGATCAPMG